MTQDAAMRTPRLARSVRLQRDTAREAWVLLGPERVLQLDQIAHAILERVDGTASIAAIVDDLAEQFSAPRQRIEQDVVALLDGLAEKGFLEFS